MAIVGKRINVTLEDLKSKKHNIFVGVSLGNKFFSPKNIKEYLLWALESTKESVLVLVADEIQAINYQVLNNYTEGRAVNVAIRKGEEKKQEISKVVSSLLEDQQNKVIIADWGDLRKLPEYQGQIDVVKSEFENNPEFQEYIIRIIDENIGVVRPELNLSDKKKLAGYVLEELPSLLCGINYDGRVYTLHPYPNLSSFDYLLEGMSNGKLFPELTTKLEVTDKIAIVELLVSWI